MGKGTYAGGHTVIGDHTPGWFGDGSPEKGGAEELRFRKAKNKLEELQQQGRAGQTGKQFRRQLTAATREMEQARKALRNAVRPSDISRAAEQDIADVRKQVQALAGRAKAAIKQHEQERERLEHMLREHGLDPAKYSETRRLTL
tara:strand:- start:561 stop:995 length:435 start_codon:yes stop_codon:yes gene_type:complete